MVSCSAHRARRSSAVLSIPAAYARGAVYLFSFLAGACGLTYEVVWSRLASVHTGDPDRANALVLGTFMGGLALGARLFGSRADTLSRPLRAYGLLEIAIGLYAVLSPLIFAATPPPGPGDLPARIALLVAGLLPPTVLMGGAFPLLTRYLTSRTLDLRRNVGELYGVNTAGAVLGGLLAGFVLLDTLPPALVLGAVGAVNAALGVVILRAARGAPDRLPCPPKGPEAAGLADAVAYGADARRLALGLAAFSGLATMALEVAWTRELTRLLADSTEGLTLMLAAFLSGSALGSWALASRTAGRFALPGVVAFALMATSVLLGVARFALDALLSADAGPLPEHLYVPCFALLLLPAVAAGMVFPAAVRLGADARRLGGRVGHIYAVNTLGTLAGAILAGLVVLPALGGAVVVHAVTLAYAIAGLALWRSTPRRPPGGALADPGRIDHPESPQSEAASVFSTTVRN
jgi:spermidine synthase